MIFASKITFSHYYSHTVFEFKTNELGAQDTILAGGRYEGLVDHKVFPGITVA